MRIVLIMAATLAVIAAAQAQSPVNPFSYTCGSYLAAQQGNERGPADAVLYWATG